MSGQAFREDLIARERIEDAGRSASISGEPEDRDGQTGPRPEPQSGLELVLEGKAAIPVTYVDREIAGGGGAKFPRAPPHRMQFAAAMVAARRSIEREGEAGRQGDLEAHAEADANRV